MNSTDSSDKKKSLLISTAIYAALLLLLFFIRFWPPYNQDKFSAMAGGGGGGVTVNFGDSDLGSGSNYKSEVLDVKNNAKQAPAKATPEEAVLTQENTADDDDRVVIPTKEKPKKNTPVVKPEEKPAPQKPKVSNSTNDALSSILKGSNKGGDGDDKTAGNKGKAGGSLSSKDYYATGGSGGGSGYSLGNRKALSKPAPKYTCDEAGKVVVEVTVDQSGRTISATPGVKGTTNLARCLLDQAKIAAMNTKWSPDSNAAVKQVGKIVYNFSLN